MLQRVYRPFSQLRQHHPVDNRRNILQNVMMNDFRTALPGADSFIAKEVSIPLGCWITEKQREFIANTITWLRG